MKKTTTVLTLLLIILSIYWSFRALMPQFNSDINAPETSFSTDRALVHVKEISKEPHAVGFPGHSEVRSYIISELEKLGLQTTVQTGYSIGDWVNLSKVTNILTRIKGKENGKALLVMSHYDSSPHSALGASDAGSGVATILEGTRAFLAQNKQPKNDIIILITDAEELGLNGAGLFVKEHQWSKDVGLILNFEARGSGGPGIMWMETNRGNANLVKEFIKAAPKYPVAYSLVYSVYKMLPNDTDLTVFREGADIDGFNFAFIDDHFDYHTVRDSYERLDKNTLAHQGSYLMPMLQHFGETDLDSVRSLRDSVYFNIPFFKTISYPFDWIWPMWGLAAILFLVLIILGFRKKVLNGIDILKGFVPVLFSLIINGIVGYYSWRVLKWLYPAYQDMLHGFTYNGHAYIFSFVFFSIGVCFYAYHKFRIIKTPNLLIGPIFIWLVLCALISSYLDGGAFFIVPVYGVLVALFILINQKKPNAFLLVFLGLPALFVFTPIIQLFPIALGLKILVATTVMTTLTFFLLLPLFLQYRNKRALALLSLLLFVGFMVSAHMNAGFTEDNAKPTSLSYVLDVDNKEAQWITYENVPSEWTAQYVETKNDVIGKLAKNTIDSKYGSNITYTSEAPLKKINSPKIEILTDTVQNKNRKIELCITPQRNVNRLEIFSNGAPIKKASVNGIELSDYFLENRSRGKLITHFISNNAYTELFLEIPKDSALELTIYEASNDLLENPLFSVPKRPKDNIPMPFILNDAVLTIQKLNFD
ncbi:MAG: M20/M25/M40 family metallo-hydrolase [Maribacter sp.]